MAVRRYPAPRGHAPAVTVGGALSREWVNYLAGIEDVSGRVAANVAKPADTTGAALKTSLDALIDALVAANLMEKP